MLNRVIHGLVWCVVAISLDEGTAIARGAGGAKEAYWPQ